MACLTSASYYRWVAVGLFAVGLALSGCGRKGPLDAPPGGLTSDPNASLNGDTEDGPGEVLRKGTARGLPIIKGPDRRIPLDVLLD